MNKDKRTKLILPTPEEDREINAGLADAPDTYEGTAEDFARATLADPALVAAYKRKRNMARMQSPYTPRKRTVPPSSKESQRRRARSASPYDAGGRPRPGG